MRHTENAPDRALRNPTPGQGRGHLINPRAKFNHHISLRK